MYVLELIYRLTYEKNGNELKVETYLFSLTEITCFVLQKWQFATSVDYN